MEPTSTFLSVGEKQSLVNMHHAVEEGPEEDVCGEA